jgi:hypothetical protein
MSMLNINRTDYLECWKLYMDLVETEFNPEDINFYDWELIANHNNYNHLDMYKKNINDNMTVIIEIIEYIIRDITNNTDGYFIIDNNILLTLHNYSYNYELIKCNDCGNIWDGNAQCNCYNYLNI